MTLLFTITGLSAQPSLIKLAASKAPNLSRNATFQKYFPLNVLFPREMAFYGTAAPKKAEWLKINWLQVSSQRNLYHAADMKGGKVAESNKALQLPQR